MVSTETVMNMTVGVIVLTLNAEYDLRQCLPHLIQSPLVLKCLVVDSSSRDGTVRVAEEMGAEVVVISRRDFNHGATREWARQLLGTDIVVMVTQDAYATGPEIVDLLVRPILDGHADVTYARQLPKLGAGVFESFPRQFNYPNKSGVRTLNDAKRLGAFTFFCSDSFSAYKQSTMDSVGGFPTVLTNEDYFAVARILEAGGSIAYVSEATVFHSHRYTLMQEFKRYFDTGYVRGERRWVQELVGSAEGHGASMVKAMLKKIAFTQIWLVPYALVQVAVKWLGYRIGFHSVRAPLWWKEALSGQPYYWRSHFAVKANRRR